MSPFEPSRPLTAAEQHVDFQAHDTHIRERREAVERAALPAAKRMAVAAAEFGLPTQSGILLVTQRLERALGATARFGFAEARREIRSYRAGGTVHAYYVPDVGAFSQQAREGLTGVLDLVHRRARETAQDVADKAGEAARREQEKLLRTAAAVTAATKVLHSHVLELVGETLNMGRTAGALSFTQPPTFALRSEQLDKATCSACELEHGEIYQVDSNDYYSHMPPTYCYGGGRCRGVYVFADGVGDVRLPEAA